MKHGQPQTERAVKQERAELARVFSRRGAQVVPSQANFVCVRTDRATLIAESLARSSIIVRRFTGRPELESCLRITCPGDAAAFARLLEALENVP